MANRIQLRRDGAQQWANVNPILAQGELGIEIDTSRLKIGDGVTAWNSLKYERPLETESNTANTLVKRDADGNFEAGAITASVIGNSATATRLANARQIALGGDMSGSGTFDGSANLTITAELNYVVALPHYDPNDLDAQGTYSQVTVDSRGRIVDANNPTTLSAYGIADAQPLDSDLTSLASMTSFGLISRQAEGTIVSRTITGGSQRIIVQYGDGASQNPFIDLADTTVVVGTYNPVGNLDTPLISATTGDETVNTTNFTVDRYGRLTYAQTSAIATAKQGTTVAVYDNAATYPRYSKVKNAADKLYEAIADISAGGGEPSHTDTSDTGSWRYLSSALAPQKGIASFSQEDFDVSLWDAGNNIEGGHVSIAERGVDNLQLQNNRVSFADGNTKEDFELDQELTAVTGYRGFNYLNYAKINDTSGNLLFGANNTGDGGAGEVDINVRTYISDPDITLDGAVDQTFDKTGDGNLNFNLTQNAGLARNLGIASTNSGAGDATLSITADNDITISATNVSNRVHIEDYWLQDNVLSTTNATLILDPNDDDDVTGLVQIRGDLQVDGTTTTVNSVTTTIQDPIITLGGEDTLTVDDNKDRGIEFRYYDSQERFGFFGWDEDYADANLWSGTGGYRFIYNATNTNEVYAGTDAAVIAGNLRLTTNTGSTSTTSGTLVVTGGVGVSENVHIGGTTTIAGQSEINNNVIFKADNKSFNIQTSGGVDKFTVDYDNGNTVIEGTVDIQLETTITDNVIIKADNKKFDIQTAAGVSVFDVDTDNGNTHTDGTLDVDSGVTFNSTLDVDAAVTFNSTLDVDDDVVLHNDFLMDTNSKFFTITNGSTQTYKIDTATGNTDIEGTVDIGGLSTFETTTNISVDTSANDAITKTAEGAVDIDGGLNVDKDVRVGGDLYVSDRIDSKDAGTARTRPSLLNNLDVRYREYIGSVAAHNADFANDPDANLRVAGGAGIVADLHVGDDFYVGKVGTNDTVEFSILGESGQTTIGRVGQGSATDGALTVHGDATFNREVNITGSLTTIGDANTDVLTVNAVSQFTDDVTVDGSLTVNTNALIEGNLTVNGTTTTVNSTVTTVDDPVMTLGGDTAPGSDDAKDRGIEFRYYDTSAKIGFFGWDNSAERYAFYHGATNSSEAFSGTRSGIDAGSLALFDTTNATNSASGAFTVGGGAGIGIDLYVGDDLVVGDAGSFGGNVDITGTLDVTNDFAVSNKFSVASATGNTNIEGTLTVDGNAQIGNAGSDSHTIDGTVQFNHAITSTDITADNIKIGVDAANEISTTSGNLVLDSDGGTVNVTDDLDVDNNLNVDGNAKVDGTLTVDGNTTIGNASGDSHSVTGTVQFNQAITSTDITADAVTIGVDSDSEISTTTGNNLILDSATGETQVDDNLTVTGTLDVNGNTQIGNQAGDAHAFTGTVQFNQAVTSTDITADNVQIGVSGASEIDTSGGNLTLDSATGETIVDDNITVTGTADIDGLTTITDALTVKADNKLVSIQNASGLTKFEIDTDNGNTDIQGTVNIEGATTVDDTFNVTQATDLDGTLNVDGVATFQNDVILNADSKNFKIQLDNGTDKFTVASASGNTDIQGTLDVAGASNIDDTLGVTGNTSITSSTNPANLIASAALAVTGGVTVAKDVFLGEDLYVGPNAAPKFSVVGASGNTTIVGTLGVTGVTTLGTAEISTINLSSNANIDGSIIVNTDKFIVAGASGNTTIDGTLDVAGATVIDDTFNVTQNVDFDSDLNVDGNQQLDGTLTVDSTSLFKDDFVLRGASKTLKLQNGSGTDKVTLHSTSGNAEITGTSTLGTLDVTNNTTIGGTLGVTGQITGNVTGALTGNASSASLVDITNTPSSNLTYYPTFVSTTSGNTEVRTDQSNLQYNPSTNTLTVTNFKSVTDFEIQGNLNVTGALTFFQSQVGSIANHTTDALAEGTTNLYYTEERVDDRVANLINGGTGITATYDDAGNMLTLSATQSDLNTDNFTEGSTNLFTTAARTRTHFTYGTGIQLDTGTLSVTQSDIDTDNVTEGSTNLFTTAARTRGHISVSGSLAYNASTGVISYTTPTTIASLSNHDTDDVAEGSSNLYYTDERVDDRLNAVIIAGTGVTKVYDDAANTYTLSVTQADINSDTITEGSTNLFTTAARTRGHIGVSGSLAYNSGTGVISYTTPDTDGITEGSSNLYYTDARADARIAAADTGDLTEGSNLYYTDARARAAISENSTQLAYNSTTGVLTYTQGDTDTVSEGSSNLYYTDARADARIAAADTDDLSEGSSNLYFTNARADARIAAADTGDLTEGSNLYYTDARADARVVAGITGKLDASAVSTFGGTLIDDADAAAARTTLGLGTAAQSATGDFATAAQGTKADDAAPLASPGLTGTPTAPTAAQATNTTQVATTAFVQSNLTATLLRTALGISEYATNAAAITGGLSTGEMYYNTTATAYVLVESP